PIVARIAPRVAVEIEEERKLDGHTAAGTPAMPRAIPGVSSLRIDVDRIARIGDGRLHVLPPHLADLVQDRAGSWRAPLARAGVDVVSAVRHRRADMLAT